MDTANNIEEGIRLMPQFANNNNGEHRRACFYRTVNTESKNLEFLEK